MSVYFLDCEFDGLGGPLISLALVKQNTMAESIARCTKAMYIVDEYSAAHAKDQWVVENVIPLIDAEDAFLRSHPNLKDLTYRFVAESTAEKRKWAVSETIELFLKNDPDPIIIADWPDDIKYFSEYLITGPGTMINIPAITFRLERIDAYPTVVTNCVQHHALCDAFALMIKHAEVRQS